MVQAGPALSVTWVLPAEDSAGYLPFEASVHAESSTWFCLLSENGGMLVFCGPKENILDLMKPKSQILLPGDEEPAHIFPADPASS